MIDESAPRTRRPRPIQKILVKGGPKQFKRGPGDEGWVRLAQRLITLTIEVERFSRRPSPDQARAQRLSDELRALVRAFPPVDIRPTEPTCAPDRLF